MMMMMMMMMMMKLTLACTGSSCVFSAVTGASSQHQVQCRHSNSDISAANKQWVVCTCPRAVNQHVSMDKSTALYGVWLSQVAWWYWQCERSRGVILCWKTSWCVRPSTQCHYWSV